MRCILMRTLGFPQADPFARFRRAKPLTGVREKVPRPRHEAEPGCKIARPFELPALTDSGDQSGRTERADSRDRG
jgi:hypothetical protein